MTVNPEKQREKKYLAHHHATINDRNAFLLYERTLRSIGIHVLGIILYDTMTRVRRRMHGEMSDGSEID